MKGAGGDLWPGESGASQANPSRLAAPIAACEGRTGRDREFGGASEDGRVPSGPARVGAGNAVSAVQRPEVGSALLRPLWPGRPCQFGDDPARPSPGRLSGSSFAGIGKPDPLQAGEGGGERRRQEAIGTACAGRAGPQCLALSQRCLSGVSRAAVPVEPRAPDIEETSLERACYGSAEGGGSGPCWRPPRLPRPGGQSSRQLSGAAPSIPAPRQRAFQPAAGLEHQLVFQPGLAPELLPLGPRAQLPPWERHLLGGQGSGRESRRRHLCLAHMSGGGTSS